MLLNILVLRTTEILKSGNDSLSSILRVIRIQVTQSARMSDVNRILLSSLLHIIQREDDDLGLNLGQSLVLLRSNEPLSHRSRERRIVQSRLVGNLDCTLQLRRKLPDFFLDRNVLLNLGSDYSTINGVSNFLTKSLARPDILIRANSHQQSNILLRLLPVTLSLVNTSLLSSQLINSYAALNGLTPLSVRTLELTVRQELGVLNSSPLALTLGLTHRQQGYRNLTLRNLLFINQLLTHSGFTLFFSSQDILLPLVNGVEVAFLVFTVSLNADNLLTTVCLVLVSLVRHDVFVHDTAWLSALRLRQPLNNGTLTQPVLSLLCEVLDFREGVHGTFNLTSSQAVLVVVEHKVMNKRTSGLSNHQAVTFSCHHGTHCITNVMHCGCVLLAVLECFMHARVKVLGCQVSGQTTEGAVTCISGTLTRARAKPRADVDSESYVFFHFILLRFLYTPPCIVSDADYGVPTRRFEFLLCSGRPLACRVGCCFYGRHVYIR